MEAKVHMPSMLVLLSVSDMVRVETGNVTKEKTDQYVAVPDRHHRPKIIKQET